MVKVKIKDKFGPKTCHDGPKGEMEVLLHSYFNFGARCGWAVNVTPRLLYPRGRDTGTHCTGGCVGPRAALG